jgi:nucleoside-diphosphate kinase
MEFVSQKTLCILKPDALSRDLEDAIAEKLMAAGLQILARKEMLLSYAQAEAFYAVHKDRAFFEELCTYISSGPIVVQVLSGVEAVSKYRTLMGATNPDQAEPGTIRGDFGQSLSLNTVHG